MKPGTARESICKSFFSIIQIRSDPYQHYRGRYRKYSYSKLQ